MKINSGILVLSGLLVMASCSVWERDPNTPEKYVRQIDISEIIPVHESSLKYFDYILDYRDNEGHEYADTIREGSILPRGIYEKTFSYTRCPVICLSNVELSPKVPTSEVVSFTFITPKPYLTPFIYYYTKSDGNNSDIILPESYEKITVQSMEIAKFISTYGSKFTSSCSVYDAENYFVR